MRVRQREHLKGLIEFLQSRVRKKYISGAEEHNNDLLDMDPEQLCLEAIDESLDQLVYLYTLYSKIRR